MPRVTESRTVAPARWTHVVHKCDDERVADAVGDGLLVSALPPSGTVPVPIRVIDIDGSEEVVLQLLRRDL